ncbi:MAG: cation diffusion facilitator family transporter, partial [Microbacterium gubbeenense]
VAAIVGIEMKSLLVGEGATRVQLTDIIHAIESGDDSPKVIHIKTLYVGPEELLVAAKIGLAVEKPLGAVARDIDEIEQRIRAHVPEAKIIYLEPDVYRDVTGEKPTTAAFVFPSSD